MTALAAEPRPGKRGPGRPPQTDAPPIKIDCLNPACQHQWLTRAQRGQSIACPRCKRHVWVKRPVPYLVPVPPPAPAAPAAYDEDGEDDETYIRGPDGTLVLAEWTEDGRLVPAAPQRPAEPAPGITADLAWRSWEVNPDAPPGGCRITETRGPGPCALAYSATVSGIRVCSAHEWALSAARRNTGQ